MRNADANWNILNGRTGQPRLGQGEAVEKTALIKPSLRTDQSPKHTPHRRHVPGWIRTIPLVEFAVIKADLPDWPDEVIEEWLLKLANRGPDTGWPPPERLDGHAWKYILGGRPLSWWKDVTWQLEEHDLKFDALSQASRRIVNQMIDAHINGVANTYSTLLDSKDRFESVARYIAENGTFPKPLVVMQLKDGLSVIDTSCDRIVLKAAKRGSPTLAPGFLKATQDQV
jgi:hypothetical protein